MTKHDKDGRIGKRLKDTRASWITDDDTPATALIKFLAWKRGHDPLKIRPIALVKHDPNATTKQNIDRVAAALIKGGAPVRDDNGDLVRLAAVAPDEVN